MENENYLEKLFDFKDNDEALEKIKNTIHERYLKLSPDERFNYTKRLSLTISAHMDGKPIMLNQKVSCNDERFVNLFDYAFFWCFAIDCLGDVMSGTCKGSPEEWAIEKWAKVVMVKEFLENEDYPVRFHNDHLN